MTVFIYILGALLAFMAMYPGSFQWAFAAAAAVFLSRHFLSNYVFSSWGFWWYVAISGINVTLGVYLVSLNGPMPSADLVRAAGLVAIFAGFANMCCSRWPNFIHHNYDQTMALLSGAFFALMAGAFYFEAWGPK